MHGGGDQFFGFDRGVRVDETGASGIGGVFQNRQRPLVADDACFDRHGNGKNVALHQRIRLVQSSLRSKEL